MRLPRFPDDAATTAPAPAPDDVFPGVLHGTKAGDFGGLPPIPGEVTARVPEVAVRLSGMAGQLGEALECRNPSLAAWLVYDVRAKLNAAAVAVAAEAGNFGGLPPAPGEVTARVPELAIRLSAIAETLAVAHHTIVNHAELQALAIDASRRLHAVADELAAESGDQ